MRNKKRRPNIGDYQIIREVQRNGRASYRVEKYDYGWDCMQWNYVTVLKTLREAIKYVEGQQAGEVVSSEVVWP